MLDKEKFKRKVKKLFPNYPDEVLEKYHCSEIIRADGSCCCTMREWAEIEEVKKDGN